MRQVRFYGIASGVLLASLLAACGGGGGGGGATSSGTTTNATIVSGVASLGPINAATVCAYAISGGAKGTAIGKCATTDINGNYSLDLGTYSGPVLFETTGGTYIDEATGQTVSLATPLRSISTGVAGSSSVAVTALTELAYQNANTAAGGLTGTNIQGAISNVQAHFGVSDIVNTMPVNALSVPAGATAKQKSYALALATVSQYQSSAGTSTATTLQTMQNCLANPATGCGTGTTTVGAALNAALNTFQAGHQALAGITLPLANFGTVPGAAPGTTTTGTAANNATWGMLPNLSWQVYVTPSINTYVLQDCFGGPSSCVSLGAGILVITNPNSGMTVTGFADGINLAGLTPTTLTPQLNCITSGLQSVFQKIAAGPYPAGGVTLDDLINTALANATSPQDVITRFTSALVAAGVPAAAGAGAGACPSGGAGTASTLTLAGSVNSSLAMITSANSGPTAKGSGFFSMYNGSSSATYQSLTDYGRAWSTNSTFNNATNTLMAGDAVLAGHFYVDQTTSAVVFAAQGFICSTNTCTISTLGTTVFALGTGASAGGCLVGTGPSPSCASAGINVNRSAGTISFTNTPMVTGTASSTGTLTAPGSATLNGTLTFTPF